MNVLKKKIFITFLFVLFVYLPFPFINAQEELQTSHPLILYMDKIYSVTPYADFYEDTNGILSFEEVRRKKFQPSNRNSYNFGMTHSVIWMRFQIQDQNSILNDQWIFFVEYPQLDSVHFYFPIENDNGDENVYKEKRGGDILRFSERDLENRFLNYLVPFEIIKNPVIYIRIKTMSVMQIPIYLSPERLFHSHNSEMQLVMGIYFGIMMIMGFYNLFLFISLQEKIYLYYVSAVFFTILYMGAFHGFGYHFIWSESPYIQNKIIPLSALCSVTCMNFFTMEFLETKKFSPYLDKVLKGLLLLSIPLFLIIFIFNNNLPIILVNSISIAYPFLFISSGIMGLIKGNKSARLYLVGWGFSSIVGFLIIMRTFGIIQELRIINYLAQFASTFEVAFFSFALADRINLLKKEKNDVEKKLITTLEQENQELEKRVKERTKELSRSNKENESLLLNILPNHVIDRIKTHEEALIVDTIPFASILFADVVGFTRLSQKIDSTELVVLLNNVFSHFDVLTMVHNLEKMKTIGDAYMVVGGLPGSIDNHLEAMADLALDILKFSQQQELIDLLMKYPDFKIRIGMHCGPAVAGIIGLEKIAYDIWGDTVNTASRMESYGLPDMIHTSRQVYDQLKGIFSFEKRGSFEIKGKGSMETYFLMERLPPKKNDDQR